MAGLDIIFLEAAYQALHQKLVKRYTMVALFQNKGKKESDAGSLVEKQDPLSQRPVGVK